MAVKKKKAAKVKITVEDWLDTGLLFFAEQGMTGINVEKISEHLKCSKGSFYWYFKTKDNFLEMMLDRWNKITTYDLIKKADAIENADEKIKYIIAVVFAEQKTKDFLFFLRKVGRENKQINDVVKNIEAQRIQYLSKVLKEYGVPENQCNLKARTLYTYYLGWYEQNKYKAITQAHIDRVYEEVALLIGFNLKNSTLN